MNQAQYEKVASAPGFVAALDQSGGSTPKALRLYGIGEDAYSNDAEMFDLIHQMRSRIITSPAFTGDRILAAILFEMTMDREIEGRGSADYLWSVKNIVPILKVDKGLESEADAVQLMKPMPGLDELLARALEKGVFGTKMRSVIKNADKAGIEAVVAQQFDIGHQILGGGLVPILEPEIDINSPTKGACEEILKESVLRHLGSLSDDQQIMLKLTLPEVDDYYLELVQHPRVLKVVALSGGYSRAEADERLARQHGVIASFSRALTQGLSAQQSDDEFNAQLDESISEIFAASMT